MTVYRVEMTDDDLAEIVDETGVAIGRALTKRDGEAIVEVLNGGAAARLRENILSAVSDAIEECFDGVPS